MSNEDINKKLVFCVAPLLEGGAPVMMIGIPRAAYENMQNGVCQDLDLSIIGLPLKLMVYGGEDHTACLKVIEDAAKAKGIPIFDERRRNFSMNPKKEGE